MTGPTLATLLNWNGFQTDYGTRYAGARGTYTLIQATYNWLESIGEDDDAERVALAFKKPDGSYAYNKWRFLFTFIICSRNVNALYLWTCGSKRS